MSAYKISSSESNGIGIIHVGGIFDGEATPVLFEHFTNLEDTAKPIIVDLAGVTKIDSSALGCLVKLRKMAYDIGVKVSIEGCSAVAMRVLKIANFQSLFEISDKPIHYSR